MINKVRDLLSHITCEVFGKHLFLLAEIDKILGNRVYVQIQYQDRCHLTGDIVQWHGRKWYLSEYMTEDEIVKTAWIAFETAIKHEVMEGFKFDNKAVFNPHVDYRALLSVTDQVRGR